MAVSTETARLTRITPAQRRTLQIVSVLLLVTGALLFLSVFFAIFRVTPMGGEGWFEQESARMGAVLLRGVIGIVLLAIGGFLANFAFLKPVSEIVATETSGAVEHAAGAAGRGLASAGIGGGTQNVKVRCRGCGYLDSEDAKYCSGCGQAM